MRGCMCPTEMDDVSPPPLSLLAFYSVLVLRCAAVGNTSISAVAADETR